jgi:hypothetical protein
MQQEQTGQDDDIILKAMELIDPSGTLVPGTVEYNAVLMTLLIRQGRAQST